MESKEAKDVEADRAAYARLVAEARTLLAMPKDAALECLHAMGGCGPMSSFVHNALLCLVASESSVIFRYAIFSGLAMLLLGEIESRAAGLWSPLDYVPLFTPCPNARESKVLLCEGRPLLAGQAPQARTESGVCKGLEDVYCPRLQSRCAMDTSKRVDCGGHRGAHIIPNLARPIEDYSLCEVAEMLRLDVYLDELREPTEAMSRLAGWVNRLYELPEHMRCRKCGKTMRPECAYSKMMASYNVTVVSCEEPGNGHDQKVYLNHCWACGSIIDSRDSPHFVEGWHLCLRCSCGPIKSMAYRPGCVCPKCNAPAPARLDRCVHDDGLSYQRRCYTCSRQECRHHFTVPDPAFYNQPWRVPLYDPESASGRDRAPAGSP